MIESQSPIDKIGRANTHEVGAPEAMIDIKSVLLQVMFGEEETEAGTIVEMIMRTAARGGNAQKSEGLEDRVRVMIPWSACITGVGLHLGRVVKGDLYRLISEDISTWHAYASTL